MALCPKTQIFDFSFLEHLELFIAVAIQIKEDLFDLEERHKLFVCGFFSIPWEKSTRRRCMSWFFV